MTGQVQEHEKPRLRVGLVQINNAFSGQNYFPLSVGMLHAYAQRHLADPGAFEFLPPVYTRVPVKSAVGQVLPSDIVLFSTYVWNIRTSLEIARQLKRERPEMILVFGGPQVPERLPADEEFLRAHPFIDLACHGEGEQVTVKILDQLQADDRDWSKVPSLSFLTSDRRFVRTPSIKRLNDLSVLPSPYLGGTFEPLVRANPEAKWIGLWETNRGCPFSCTFCDWGSATQSKVSKFELDRLFGELEWFADHRVEFVLCCDSNFGMLPRDIEIAAHAAKTKRERGYPHALSVQNTKNATERTHEVHKILAAAGLSKGVDLALQSSDPSTLVSIKRANISTETYSELQRRFTRDGIDTYTDIILGLPGETYDSFANGISNIMANGQHNRVQYNICSILPNAEMGDPEYQKKYGLQTVESEIGNMHGAIEEMQQEIRETQRLVIETHSMPREEWVRARVFSWMSSLLHFDKVLQIPLVVMSTVAGIRYRELLELFFSGRVTEARYPTLSSIRSFFFDKAGRIQQGDFEYCPSKEWLGMLWPADEYMLIEVCTAGKLETFYREAEGLLSQLLEEKDLSFPEGLLHSAVLLMSKLLKMPFQTTDLTLALPYNVWEFYRSVLRGEPIPLERRRSRVVVKRTGEVWNSWEDWCREVIWYGNKRGAYMYGNVAVGLELAGHY